MRAAHLTLGLVLALCLNVFGQSTALQAATTDLDRDGIDDSTEQSVLMKFLPHFQIVANDCDGAPSQFRAGTSEPEAIAQDGTIYGQVFPVAAAVEAQSGAVVEVHYYHLWRQDCGKRSHALDAEHVSALVSAPTLSSPIEQWTALYWYSSAHQGTPCDKSHAASASALHAVTEGPQVVISAGKHASYLDASLCKHGCGADRCVDTIPLVVPRVVNLGEPGLPLNGSDWTASSQWPLRAKMATDFPEPLLAELRAADATSITATHKPVTGVQTTILTAGVTASALATASQDTGNALDTANTHTNDALDRSARSVQTALQKAAASTGRFLGLSSK